MYILLLRILLPLGRRMHYLIEKTFLTFYLWHTELATHFRRTIKQPERPQICTYAIAVVDMTYATWYIHTERGPHVAYLRRMAMRGLVCGISYGTRSRFFFVGSFYSFYPPLV